MIRFVSAFTLVGALALCSGGISWSQSSPAQVVKERQDIMAKLWPDYYRDISRTLRGEKPDLSLVVAKSAQAIEPLKKAAQLFPAGSSHDAVPTSRAKPEIWTQRADFEAALLALITETNALNEAAKSDNVEAVKAQWLKVAEACGGCHGGPKKAGGKFRFEE